MSIFLIGFRSRMVVTLNPLWNYLTFERGTRLITGQFDSGARPRGAPRMYPKRMESA
jgi:NADH:ubiquinone reductase (H+-translocating)